MASSITALVLEKNDNVFINSEVSVGAIMQVPTPDGGASQGARAIGMLF